MSQRPWTCVYIDDDRTLLTTEIAGFTRLSATQELKDKYPGYQLRALIPGDHSAAGVALGSEPVAGEAWLTDPFGLPGVMED